MSDIIDISIGLTEEVVEINSTPNVVEVNIITGQTINPLSYDLIDFTNISANPFVQYNILGSYTPISRALTINGVTQDLSADRSWTISTSTGITIGTTAITSGTVGRVLFEGTGNVVQESANLFWDNTNARLGLGTASPSTTFHLAGSSTAVSLLARSSLISSTLVASANNDVLIGLDIAPTFTNGAFSGVSNLGIRLNAEFLVSNGKAFTSSSGATANSGGFSVGQFFCVGNSGNNGYVALQGLYAGIGYTTPISINALGGNVLIGTTTNAGFKLDVNGTARVSGQTTIKGTTNNDTTNIFRIEQQNGNGRFLVNAAGQTQIVGDSFQSSESFVRLERNAFNPTSGGASHTSLLIVPTINQTGGAYGITRGLYIAPTLTSAFDFRAIETTAGNVIFNGGNVGIGTTSPSTLLHVAGNITIGGASATTVSSTYNSTTRNQIRYTNGASLEFHEGANERVRIGAGTGNILINTTTDAGYKLDVNGTARVGVLTCGNINPSATTNVSGITFSTGTMDVSTNNDMRLIIPTSAKGAIVSQDYSFLSSASALFEVKSTTKGFLPPRMTTTQINAIVSPAEGLTVYNTTISHMCFYQAGSWVKINHSPM